MPRFAHDRPHRKEKPWIIIVCDGENTEPQYFRYLRNYIWKVSPVFIGKNDIIGTGYNRKKTISECKRVFIEKRRVDKWYIEAWSVFDGDPKRDDSSHDAGFVEAVSCVESHWKPEWLHGVYSFEAFEYWFLLHFEKLDGSPISRDDYVDRLNSYLRKISPTVRYDGDSKEVSEELFWILIDRVDFAIANAQTIDDGSWKPIWKPHERNAITKVYKLVKRILWK